jgi:hypothetical protein
MLKGTAELFEVNDRSGRVVWALIALTTVLLVFLPVVAVPVAAAALLIAHMNGANTPRTAAAAVLIMTLIMLAFRGPGAFFFENAGRSV